MRTTLLVSASLIVLGLGSQAFAASAEDAAYDKNKQAVIDVRGNCVRTKWQDQNDPCAAAPAPKPAPKPVPVAAPAPVTPPPQISREARTVYFDFDKSVLTSEAQQKLDELANTINSSRAITDVTIHGYTDQLGTDAYNGTLANQRVAAVKDYLDSRSRLKAEGDIRGLGKATPEASCKGLKRTKRIACMSAERRVEVEFNAQK